MRNARWLIGLLIAGLIETLETKPVNRDCQSAAAMQLRRMQRLRRDLSVNFAGAAVILDLVQRLEQLNRELIQMQERLGD